MVKLFSQLLDTISNYLAKRKGLLPMIGMVMIITNFFLQLLEFVFHSLLFIPALFLKNKPPTHRMFHTPEKHVIKS